MFRVKSLFVAMFIGLAAASTALATPMYTITDLGTLGGTQSQGFGINDSGQVSGDAFKVPGGGTNRAFLYDGSSMNDLGTLNPSSSLSTSFGRGINNLGQTVGRSFRSDGTERAFFHNGTSMIELPTLGGLFGNGQDINDSGVITGFSMIAGGGRHAFSFDDSTMNDLGTLGGNESFGHAINSTGQIAGWSDAPDNSGTGSFIQQAFFYDGTDMIDLGFLGGADSRVGFLSRAFGINDFGHVVGTSAVDNTGKKHAFLWDGADMIDLGILGVAFGVNNAGQVVGQAGPDTSSSVTSHAFLWNDTDGMLDLNTLIDPSDPLIGATLLNANAINSSGQITGQAIIDGQFHAYLLTIASPPSEPDPEPDPDPVSNTDPDTVPEPTTLAIFGIGLAGLAAARRRRKAA